MHDRSCSITGCGMPVRCKKLCNSHYRKSLRPRRLTTKERYEAKVDRSAGTDACHPWTAARNKPGYGLFCHDGETLAARWAYKHYIGPLADGVMIRHTCDNPPCQNRNHWLTGSNHDNMLDKLERNRQHRPRGESNVKAVLTANQVREIRGRYCGGRGEQRWLAKEYGVSPATVGNIVRGKTWTSV